MSTPTPSPLPPKPTRFSAYKQTLALIAKRTGAPLPSLILSFGVVHELTALVPLVGTFYAARGLGVGERVVAAIAAEEAEGESSSSTSTSSSSSSSTPHTTSSPQTQFDLQTYAHAKLKSWVSEGDRWAVRIGRRYGVFGYEKRAPGEVDDVEALVRAQRGRIAGDVANAVVAYGVTKALFPVRIGVSLYLAPMFSRAVVEPIRKTIMGVFGRRG